MRSVPGGKGDQAQGHKAFSTVQQPNSLCCTLHTGHGHACWLPTQGLLRCVDLTSHATRCCKLSKQQPAAKLLITHVLLDNHLCGWQPACVWRSTGQPSLMLDMLAGSYLRVCVVGMHQYGAPAWCTSMVHSSALSGLHCSVCKRSPWKHCAAPGAVLQPEHNPNHGVVLPLMSHTSGNCISQWQCRVDMGLVCVACAPWHAMQQTGACMGHLLVSDPLAATVWANICCQMLICGHT